MVCVCTVSDKLLYDKNPVISFRVVEDGARPVDESDSNLVIDTSDGHQVRRQLKLIFAPCDLHCCFSVFVY